jgi:hypothetical protein
MQLKPTTLTGETYKVATTRGFLGVKSEFYHV